MGYAVVVEHFAYPNSMKINLSETKNRSIMYIAQNAQHNNGTSPFYVRAFYVDFKWCHFSVNFSFYYISCSLYVMMNYR
jgi:hypothetical protein